MLQQSLNRNRHLLMLFVVIVSCISINSSGQKITINDSVPFELSAQSQNVTYEEANTTVSVSKIIQKSSDGSNPQTVIKIHTPHVVSLEFVIAIDSSGSMGLGGDPEFGKSIEKLIPEVLVDEWAKNSDKSINVSFICWDDDIDYESKQFIDIYNASKEFQNISLVYAEDEFTDLDVGLNSSISFFSTHPSNSMNLTRRFVIYICDRSEFKNYTSGSIQKAIINDFEIYPIGIYVPGGSMMENALSNMALVTHGYYNYSSGSDHWTKQTIKNRIEDQIDRAIDDIILDNISISLSTQPYLHINNNTILIKIDGTTIPNEDIVVGNAWNTSSDGTSTLEIKLSKGLKPYSTMEISLDTDVDITIIDDTPYVSTTNTSNSQVQFKWHNGKEFKISLPSNEIRISNISGIYSTQPNKQNDIGFFKLVNALFRGYL